MSHLNSFLLGFQMLKDIEQLFPHWRVGEAEKECIEGSLSLCLVSKQFQKEKVDKNFVVSNLYGSVIKGWWTNGKFC